MLNTASTFAALSASPVHAETPQPQPQSLSPGTPTIRSSGATIDLSGHFFPLAPTPSRTDTGAAETAVLNTDLIRSEEPPEPSTPDHNIYAGVRGLPQDAGATENSAGTMGLGAPTAATSISQEDKAHAPLRSCAGAEQPSIADWMKEMGNHMLGAILSADQELTAACEPWAAKYAASPSYAASSNTHSNMTAVMSAALSSNIDALATFLKLAPGWMRPGPTAGLR